MTYSENALASELAHFLYKQGSEVTSGKGEEKEC